MSEQSRCNLCDVKRLLVFTVIISAALTTPLQGQVITNGDFEIPDTTDFYFGAPEPWHSKGTANYQIRDNSVGVGDAQSGSQYFVFDDIQSSDPGIYQDISGLITGRLYIVSYWVSARGAQGTTFYGPWSVVASAAGATNQYTNYIPISSTHDSNPGSEYSPWINRQLSFVATDVTNRLTFDVIGYYLGESGSGAIPVLDNVSIILAPPPFSVLSMTGDVMYCSGTWGDPDLPYHIEVTTNLTSSPTVWEPLHDGMFSSDGSFNFSVAMGGLTPAASVRVRYMR